MNMNGNKWDKLIVQNLESIKNNDYSFQFQKNKRTDLISENFPIHTQLFSDESNLDENTLIKKIKKSKTSELLRIASIIYSQERDVGEFTRWWPYGRASEGLKKSLCKEIYLRIKDMNIDELAKLCTKVKYDDSWNDEIGIRLSKLLPNLRKGVLYMHRRIFWKYSREAFQKKIWSIASNTTPMLCDGSLMAPSLAPSQNESFNFFMIDMNDGNQLCVHANTVDGVWSFPFAFIIKGEVYKFIILHPDDLRLINQYMQKYGIKAGIF